MSKYLIYPDYDLTQPPVGFVEIKEESGIDLEVLSECAIVPTSVIDIQTQEVKNVVNFGLIPRTNVDTRSREEKLK